jgi:hypothetical protein
MQVAIRAGGQTGVDRAALDFALRRGLRYGGWCPLGGWADDHTTVPGVLAAYPLLTETPCAAPEQRTAWNVRDSHATIILVRGAELEQSPGAKFTRQAAELIFLRPCLVVDISGARGLAEAREWFNWTAAPLRLPELWLNVAGPRESHAPGIYAESGAFLEKLFA